MHDRRGGHCSGSSPVPKDTGVLTPEGEGILTPEGEGVLTWKEGLLTPEVEGLLTPEGEGVLMWKEGRAGGRSGWGAQAQPDGVPGDGRASQQGGSLVNQITEMGCVQRMEAGGCLLLQRLGRLHISGQRVPLRVRGWLDADQQLKDKAVPVAASAAAQPPQVAIWGGRGVSPGCAVLEKDPSWAQDPTLAPGKVTAACPGEGCSWEERRMAPPPGRRAGVGDPQGLPGSPCRPAPALWTSGPGRGTKVADV